MRAAYAPPPQGRLPSASGPGARATEAVLCRALACFLAPMLAATAAALAWADGAFADESAHAMYQTCSRMGHCDYTSGQCQCQPTPPFGGSDCRQLRCEKGCGGHGRCVARCQLGKLPSRLPSAIIGADPSL